CVRRHLFPHPPPRQFQAIERLIGPFLRQLHRPLAGVMLLALSMPQRDPPLPEPQVRGIEIGRVQRLLRQPEGGTGNLGKVGQLKADVHRELHLAFEVFGVWRHCALSPFASVGNRWTWTWASEGVITLPPLTLGAELPARGSGARDRDIHIAEIGS